MADSTSILHYLNCVVIVVTLLVNPLSCHGQRMFIFGDSLYDPGNKQHLTLLPVPANSYPYGVSVGKATGRWSDGLIVPDYLAEFLEIPQIPPVLDRKADLSYGASYATADATALGHNSMDLSDQVTRFVNSKTTWTNEARASALYLFYIGSQDYLNFLNIQWEPPIKRQQAIIHEVVQKIKESIIAIHQAGGRKFAFQNMVPLGCLPVVKQKYRSKDKCVTFASDMAEEHNKLLLQALNELEATLDGFMYSIYNYFSSTVRRVDDVKRYTYTMGNVACCGVGSNYGERCGGFGPYHLCSDPNDYLFFDGKHNTQKANEQVARLMWSADPVVINPMNIRELNAFPTSVTINDERKFQRYGIDLKTLMTL